MKRVGDDVIKYIGRQVDLASQSNSILVNWINQTKTKNNFISLSYVTDQSAWGLNRSPNGTRISNYYFETNNVIIDFESFFKSYNDTYIGWIPRNFEIFIFKPKLPFLSENHKNDNKGEFSGWILGFSQVHPIYVFLVFPRIAHSDNGYYHEKFWKQYKGRIHEIPGMRHPNERYFWISSIRIYLSLRS